MSPSLSRPLSTGVANEQLPSQPNQPDPNIVADLPYDPKNNHNFRGEEIRNWLYNGNAMPMVNKVFDQYHIVDREDQRMVSGLLFLRDKLPSSGKDEAQAALDRFLGAQTTQRATIGNQYHDIANTLLKDARKEGWDFVNYYVLPGYPHKDKDLFNPPAA
jgi:hypothetical protein